MIVYRVEDEHGNGPYVARVRGYNGPRTRAAERLGRLLRDQHGWGDHDHPSPAEDGIAVPEHRDTYVCGFASLDQATQWFAGWGERLYTGGYDLMAYDVPDEHVRVGDRQVMFDTHHAVVPETNWRVNEDPRLPEGYDTDTREVFA